MDGNEVSDISAGAGEGVGRVVNGAGLTTGSIARSGACGGGDGDSLDNELVKVRGFSEGDRRGPL